MFLPPWVPLSLCPSCRPARPQTPRGRKELGAPWGSESREPSGLLASLSPAATPRSVSFPCCRQREADTRTLVGVTPLQACPLVGRKLRRTCLPLPCARPPRGCPPPPTSTPQWHPLDPEGTRCQASPCAWAVPQAGGVPHCSYTQGQGLLPLAPEWTRALPWEGSGRGKGAGWGAQRQRRRSEREAGTGARWAKQKQKLSRKRRINSRHHAPRRAYAPQAGNTSTQ